MLDESWKTVKARPRFWALLLSWELYWSILLEELTKGIENNTLVSQDNANAHLLELILTQLHLKLDNTQGPA